jgi:hypothetical protein
MYARIILMLLCIALQRDRLLFAIIFQTLAGSFYSLRFYVSFGGPSYKKKTSEVGPGNLDEVLSVGVDNIKNSNST